MSANPDDETAGGNPLSESRVTESRDTASQGTATRYRLAITTSPVDFEAAFPVLKELLGYNPIDARFRLRHLPAVWPEEFDEALAREGARRLREIGVKAAAVAVSEIPDLRHAPTLHHVQCKEEGFVILSITGAPEQTVPWSDVSLMSVAAIPGLHRSSPDAAADGIYRHTPIMDQLQLKTDRHGLELWLVFEAPFRACRIDAAQMNYDWLGDQLAPSTEVNFTALLHAIVQRAPHLTLTPTASAYLNKSHLPDYDLPTSDAHRDALLAHWLVNRSHETEGEETDEL